MSGRSSARSNAAPPGITVTVTVVELEQLRNRLGCFASLTHPDLSRLRVSAASDGRVEWTATDAFRLGRLTAGTARGGEATFGIPLRTLTLAWQMADRRDADSVTFTVDRVNGGVSRSGRGDDPGDADRSGHDGDADVGDAGPRPDRGLLLVDGVEVPFDAGLEASSAAGKGIGGPAAGSDAKLDGGSSTSRRRRRQWSMSVVRIVRSSHAL
jgi:hypothetical protein